MGLKMRATPSGNQTEEAMSHQLFGYACERKRSPRVSVLQRDKAATAEPGAAASPGEKVHP